MTNICKTKILDWVRQQQKDVREKNREDVWSMLYCWQKLTEAIEAGDFDDEYEVPWGDR